MFAKGRWIKSYFGLSWPKTTIQLGSKKGFKTSQTELKILKKDEKGFWRFKSRLLKQKDFKVRRLNVENYLRIKKSNMWVLKLTIVKGATKSYLFTSSPTITSLQGLPIIFEKYIFLS